MEVKKIRISKRDECQRRHECLVINCKEIVTLLWRYKKMVKVTHAAITKITNEVQDVINEGKKPLIRLSMGIG